MHAVTTMKHWSHHLHDGMLATWHHIDQHIHSRHFWTGVGITLLVIGLATLVFMGAKYVPIESGGYPYSLPYGS